jgi:hypothetical protein
VKGCPSALKRMSRSFVPEAEGSMALAGSWEGSYLTAGYLSFYAGASR